MDNRYVEDFKKIINISANSLIKWLNQKLTKEFNYKTILKEKDYLYAEGDIPLMLVAHLDTVFRENYKILYYDPIAMVAWSPDGAGFDDRAGVLGILTILKNIKVKPHILFTMEEEKGGRGARAAASELNMRNKLKYIIELDRRGKNDCVFYDCHNEYFKNYVESFGFKTDTGSFSDISFLGPVWNVAAVNLSIGYEDEHTYAEHLNFNYWIYTIQKVIKMIKNINNSKYYKFLDKHSKKVKAEVVCECCGYAYPIDSIVQVMDVPFCIDCYNTYIKDDWGEHF